MGALAAYPAGLLAGAMAPSTGRMAWNATNGMHSPGGWAQIGDGGYGSGKRVVLALVTTGLGWRSSAWGTRRVDVVDYWRDWLMQVYHATTRAYVVCLWGRYTADDLDLYYRFSLIEELAQDVRGED